MKRSLPLLTALVTVAFGACGEAQGDTGLALEGQLQAAQSELASGHPADARADFEAVLEADPGSIDARFGLAESARQDGDLGTAQRALEEVLGLGADRADLSRALSGLADLRRDAGDEASAQTFDAQAESLRTDPALP